MIKSDRLFMEALKKQREVNMNDGSYIPSLEIIFRDFIRRGIPLINVYDRVRLLEDVETVGGTRFDAGTSGEIENVVINFDILPGSLNGGDGENLNLDELKYVFRFEREDGFGYVTVPYRLIKRTKQDSRNIRLEAEYKRTESDFLEKRILGR